MENQNLQKWYDKKALVIVLCLLFFPVGLYAAWKSNVFSKGWKLGLTMGVALLVIVALTSNDKTKTSTVTTNAVTNEEIKDTLKKEIETDKVVNSEWDGSVKQAKDYLKENLKDWDSYESIQWGKVIKYSKASDVIGLGEITKHCVSKTGSGKTFSDDSEMDKGDKVYILGKSNGYSKIRMFPNDSIWSVNNKLTYWAAWVQDNFIKPVTAYPGFNGGGATYVIPSHQEQTSYTPLVINQHIKHTKVVWDNSIAVGKGRITGLFSYQLNQRQETNDPTMVNTPDIYYQSNAATYDVRYVAPQMGGFNYSAGVNGLYQNSQSLGTLMLIPNYNLFQIGGFAIASEKIGNLTLSGGIRYDTRTFNGVDHWVDSNQVPVPADKAGGIHEFQGFTTKFSGMSGSFGTVYNFKNNFYAKANLARGYRAPNVSECAANGIHDGTVVWELGNANLKPEFSLEEDLAIGMNGKDISFEVDMFNNSINNFIYAQGLTSKNGGDSLNNTFPAVSIGPAPVYKYTQGNAQLYGGEAMLNIHPRVISWLELNSTLSVVQGGLKNVADSVKVLPFVPPTRVTVDLKFKFKKAGKSIKNAYIKAGMLDCFQQNKIYEQYAVYNGYSQTGTPFEYAASKKATEGYVLFNAGLGGDITNSTGQTICKLYFVCNNMFNTVYMDYMSRFKYYPVNYNTGRVGVYNMGRNFSIKLIIPINFKK